MNPLKNPFSAGAGAPPPELVGRDAVLKQAVRRSHFVSNATGWPRDYLRIRFAGRGVGWQSGDLPDVSHQSHRDLA